MRLCCIQKEQYPKLLFCIMALVIILWKLLPHLLGANELIPNGFEDSPVRTLPLSNIVSELGGAVCWCTCWRAPVGYQRQPANSPHPEAVGTSILGAIRAIFQIWLKTNRCILISGMSINHPNRYPVCETRCVPRLIYKNTITTYFNTNVEYFP